VHPTQAIEIIGNVSTLFGIFGHLRPSGKNFTAIAPGEPLRRGLNQRGVEKCSDFGHFQGYISETVQDRR